MNIKANLIMPSIQELEKMTGLSEGGKVQQFIDGFVLYHSRPYLPGRRHLHDSGVTATKIGSGQVVWNSPDANYLCEGKLMVDELTHSSYARKNTQKIMDPKGRDLHYSGEPQRGSKWFDRMIETEMDELVKGVQNIVNGGNSDGK